MNARSTSNAALRSLLWVVGFGLCIGLYFGLSLGFLHRWTRAAGDDHVSIYLHTPDVSPGDPVKLAIEVFGGERAAIDAIDMPDQSVHADGEGARWGSRITSRDIGTASSEIDFAAPPEQGQRTIRIRVGYTIAVSTDGRSFRNERDVAEIALPLTVSSPGAALAMRASRGAFALALFAGLWLVLRRFGRRLWAALNAPPGDATDTAADRKAQGAALGMMAIGIAGLLIYAGYRWFALPLVAATGITSDAFVAAATVVWLVAPPLLVRLEPPPPAPVAAYIRPLGPELAAAPRGYRADPTAAGARAIDVAALRRAIEAIPARIRSERGRLAVWVGEAKHPVTIAFVDPRAITLEALRIHAIEDEPVVAVACALAPLLGAFELWFGGVMAIVDGARSAEEITREMRRAQEARLERVLAALRPTK